jgi:hypothetical protein
MKKKKTFWEKLNRMVLINYNIYIYFYIIFILFLYY